MRTPLILKLRTPELPVYDEAHSLSMGLTSGLISSTYAQLGMTRQQRLDEWERKQREAQEAADHFYWEYAVKQDYKRSDEYQFFVLPCERCEEPVIKVRYDNFTLESYRDDVRKFALKHYKAHLRLHHPWWLKSKSPTER